MRKWVALTQRTGVSAKVMKHMCVHRQIYRAEKASVDEDAKHADLAYGIVVSGF